MGAILSYGGYLTPASGSIEEEKYSAASEQCLVINTNAVRYAIAWKIVSGFERLSEADFDGGQFVALGYSLGEDDCIALMLQVAAIFEPYVTVPYRSDTELPLAYMRRLIDEN